VRESRTWVIVSLSHFAANSNTFSLQHIFNVQFVCVHEQSAPRPQSSNASSITMSAFGREMSVNVKNSLRELRHSWTTLHMLGNEPANTSPAVTKPTTAAALGYHSPQHSQSDLAAPMGLAQSKQRLLAMHRDSVDHRRSSSESPRSRLGHGQTATSSSPLRAQSPNPTSEATTTTQPSPLSKPESDIFKQIDKAVLAQAKPPSVNQKRQVSIIPGELFSILVFPSVPIYLRSTSSLSHLAGQSHRG
jgi:hypothetical protein